MRHVFIDRDKISASKATIMGREARHLSIVLRASPGDKIKLFDGTGIVYLAEIKKVQKSSIEVEIISSEEISSTPPYLHLGMGLLKGKKMDFIIQKANELGVESIYPFSSQNCAVPPPTDNQNARWQRIILESCKQCGRSKPMTCHRHMNFKDLIVRCDHFNTKIIAWENATDQSLNNLNVIPKPKSTILLIGSEGGFQADEIEFASQYNFDPTTLGSKILRAETAAITTISISQFLLGNLN